MLAGRWVKRQSISQQHGINSVRMQDQQFWEMATRNFMWRLYNTVLHYLNCQMWLASLPFCFYSPIKNPIKKTLTLNALLPFTASCWLQNELIKYCYNFLSQSKIKIGESTSILTKKPRKQFWICNPAAILISSLHLQTIFCS